MKRVWACGVTLKSNAAGRWAMLHSRTMESAVVTVISSLAGALVGGLMAAWGAMKAVEKTSHDLEMAEIRRERIDCLVALSGLRFTLNAESALPVEWQARLMYELNKIPSLWVGDEKALNSFQRYLDNSSPDNFASLLRRLSQATKLNLENVRDTDLIRYARPISWNQS